MGYIKKLKNNELIGGTDKHTIYPVTSTKAVFEEVTEGDKSSFKSQETINSEHDDRIKGLESEMPDTIKSITINGGTKTYLPEDGNVKLTIYSEGGEDYPGIAEIVQNNTDNIEAIQNEIGTDTTEDTLSGRIKGLETTIGTGGSVDQRISDAVTNEKNRAESIEGGLQTKLSVGAGITLTQDGVISATADPSVGKVVEARPIIDIVDGMIYLVQTDTPGTYKQWVHSNEEWVDKGNISLAITTDDTLDSTSSNPIQNAAIAAQIGYFVCGNGYASSETKDVDALGFKLPDVGGDFKIKMNAANTHAGPVYLRFNSSNGTKAELKYNRESVSPTNTWEEGEVISVYYDGTYYQASNAMGGGNAGKNELKQLVGYIPNSGDTIGTLQPSGTIWRSIKYPVSPGDVVQITGVGGVGQGFLWAIGSTVEGVEDTVIARSKAGAIGNGLVLLMPEGAECITINCNINESPAPKWYFAKAGSVAADAMLAKSAEHTKYDNSQSRLAAEDVQGALDEIGNKINYNDIYNTVVYNGSDNYSFSVGLVNDNGTINTQQGYHKHSELLRTDSSVNIHKDLNYQTITCVYYKKDGVTGIGKTFTEDAYYFRLDIYQSGGVGNTVSWTASCNIRKTYEEVIQVIKQNSEDIAGLEVKSSYFNPSTSSYVNSIVKELYIPTTLVNIDNVNRIDVYYRSKIGTTSGYIGRRTNSFYTGNVYTYTNVATGDTVYAQSYGAITLTRLTSYDTTTGIGVDAGGNEYNIETDLILLRQNVYYTTNETSDICDVATRYQWAIGIVLRNGSTALLNMYKTVYSYYCEERSDEYDGECPSTFTGDEDVRKYNGAYILCNWDNATEGTSVNSCSLCSHVDALDFWPSIHIYIDNFESRIVELEKGKSNTYMKDYEEGKNFVDTTSDGWLYGYRLTSGGGVTSQGAGSLKVSPFYEVKGRNIVTNAYRTYMVYGYCVYNKNKENGGFIRSCNTSGIYTYKEGDYYIRFTFNRNPSLSDTKPFFKPFACFANSLINPQWKQMHEGDLFMHNRYGHRHMDMKKVLLQGYNYRGMYLLENFVKPSVGNSITMQIYNASSGLVQYKDESSYLDYSRRWFVVGNMDNYDIYYLTALDGTTVTATLYKDGWSYYSVGSTIPASRHHDASATYGNRAFDTTTKVFLYIDILAWENGTVPDSLCVVGNSSSDKIHPLNNGGDTVLGKALAHRLADFVNPSYTLSNGELTTTWPRILSYGDSIFTIGNRVVNAANSELSAMGHGSSIVVKSKNGNLIEQVVEDIKADYNAGNILATDFLVVEFGTNNLSGYPEDQWDDGYPSLLRWAATEIESMVGNRVLWITGHAGTRVFKYYGYDEKLNYSDRLTDDALH